MMKKRLGAAFLALCMMLTLLPGTVLADDSGTNWSYNSSTKTLTIDDKVEASTIGASAREAQTLVLSKNFYTNNKNKDKTTILTTAYLDGFTNLKTVKADFQFSSGTWTYYRKADEGRSRRLSLDGGYATYANSSFWIGFASEVETIYITSDFFVGGAVIASTFFSYFDHLQWYEVEAQEGKERYYFSENGVLYEMATVDGQTVKSLVHCPPYLNSGSTISESGYYVIPQDVAGTLDSQYTFVNYNGLTIYFPEKLAADAYDKILEALEAAHVPSSAEKKFDVITGSKIVRDGSAVPSAIEMEVDDTLTLGFEVYINNGSSPDANTKELVTVTGWTLERIDGSTEPLPLSIVGDDKGNTVTISANKAGKAALKVSFEYPNPFLDGDESPTRTSYAECTVIVNDRNVSQLTLTPNPLVLSGVDADLKQDLTVTIKPADATNRAVTLTVAKPDIVTLSGDNLTGDPGTGIYTLTMPAAAANAAEATATVTVTPVKSGSTSLTAVSQDSGAVMDTCNVTVASAVSSVALSLTAAAANGLKIVDDTPNDWQDVRALEITRESGSNGNRSFDLNAVLTLNPNATYTGAVEWYSSRPEVATVTAKAGNDRSATVATVSPGETVLVARTEEGVVGKCTLTVFDPVTRVLISQDKMTVTPGGTGTLLATVEPSTADQRVTWTSGNDAAALSTTAGSIASVDAALPLTVTGASATVITSVTDCTVTVKSDANTAISAQCVVTVKEPVTGVTITGPSNPLELDLYQKDSEDNARNTALLSATVRPNATEDGGKTATNQTLKWKSLNPEIVKLTGTGISAEGVLTATAEVPVTVEAVAPGEAIILVTTADESKTDTFTVKVNPVAVGVSLDKPSLSMGLASTALLEATIYPEGASYSSLSWSVKDGRNEITLPANASDKSVTLTSYNTETVRDGGTPNPVTVTVTVTAGGKTYTAESQVSVSRKGVEQVVLDNNYLTMELAPSNGTTNTTKTLTATVAPKDPTNKKLTWTSSDESVVKLSVPGESNTEPTQTVTTEALDSDGKATVTLTALKTGVSVIKVTSSDGSYSATCAVTVEPRKVTEIRLGDDTRDRSWAADLVSTAKSETTLTAVLTEDGPTHKSLSWFSTDPDVVTVESDSRTPLASGTDSNGNKQTTDLSEDGKYAYVKLAAHKTGKAVVYVLSEDGPMAKCTVTVSDTTITGVKLDQSTLSLTLTKPEGSEPYTASGTLKATVLPEGTKQECTLSWSGGVENVLTLSADPNPISFTGNTNARENTVTLTGLKATAGDIQPITVTVTVTVGTTTYTDTCQVTVIQKAEGVTIEPYDDTQPAIADAETDHKSVILEKSKSDTTETTTSIKLRAVVAPSDRTLSDSTVTWRVSDPTLLKIEPNSDGTATVTPATGAGTKATGTAAVIVLTNDGGYQDTLNVRVRGPFADVTLNLSELELKTTDSAGQALSATVTPSTADTLLSWRSVLLENGEVKKDEGGAEVSGETVATVDQNGVVRPVAPGTARIYVTATVDSAAHEKYCDVTVYAPVTDVTMTRITPGGEGESDTVTPLTIKTQSPAKHGQVLLDVSDTCQLGALISGPDSTTEPSNKAVTWSSTREGIASVNSEGVVTAVTPGTASIFVRTEDGNFTDYCTVVVTAPVTEVTLNESTLELGPNQSKTLLATVKPANASELQVRWSSSDTAVATVRSSGDPDHTTEGQVAYTGAVQAGPTYLETDETPKTAKTATITVTVSYKDKSGNTKTQQKTCTVTMAKGAVTQLTLDKQGETLEKDGTVALTASIQPTQARETGVLWKSSDPEIAFFSDAAANAAKDQITVSAGTAVTVKGGTKPGLAIITAESIDTYDGDKHYSAFCAVYVKSKPVTGITWDGTVNDTLAINTTDRSIATLNLNLTNTTSALLKEIVSPADATEPTVYWSTSDASIVDVQRDSTTQKVLRTDGGAVTIEAKRGGTATITARTKDNSFTASCTVNVVGGTDGITLQKDAVTLDVGETDTLAATLTAVTGGSANLTWTVTQTPASGTTTDVLSFPGNDSMHFTDNTASYTGSGNTLAIKALGAGTATVKVKVTAADGSEKIASCAVTVRKGVTGVSINQPADDTLGTATGGLTVTSFSAGAKTLLYTIPENYDAAANTPLQFELTPTVLPDGATVTLVSWDSSNKAVATVSAPEAGTGKVTVTVTATGSTVLSVVTADGGKADACTLKVEHAVKGVEIRGAHVKGSAGSRTLTLNVDETELLSAAVSSQGSTDERVQWAVTNPAGTTVVELSAGEALDAPVGTLTAKATGTATVTLTSKKDTNKSDTLTVTVVRPVTGVTITGDAVKTEENGVRGVLLRGIGTTASLSAQITPASPNAATNQAVTWSSANTDIATVSDAGVVTAVAAGTTMVTVTTEDGGYRDSVPATVQSSNTGITLDHDALTLIPGDGALLRATVEPAGAEQSVTWSSSDESVARVENGYVTAVAEGSAIITVKSTLYDSSKQPNEQSALWAACTVTVTGMTLPETLSIAIPASAATASKTLTATLSQTTASDKAVTWSSSDTSVLTIDGGDNSGATKTDTAQISSETGKLQSTVTLTGHKTGSATVTAVYAGKTLICHVTVGGTAVTGVKLKKDGETDTLAANAVLTLSAEGTQKLTAVVEPDGASGAVIWSSSDPTLVAVGADASGTTATVTAISPTGTKEVRITATSVADSSQSACVVVKVDAKLRNVTLNKTELTLDKDRTETLTALTAPSAVTPALTWSASPEGVVTIDSNTASTGAGYGRITITAANYGRATVTAMDANGDKYASCTVTVPKLELSASSLALDKTVTRSQTLTLSVTPAETASMAGEVSWEVLGSAAAPPVTLTNAGSTLTAGTGAAADTAVATATVQAEALGSATVKVTWNGRSVYCPVTVTQIPATATLKLYRENENESPAEVTIWSPTVGDANLTLIPKTVSGDTPTTVAELNKLIWYSDNSNIASVTKSASGNGEIEAKSAGSATITAMLPDGSMAVSCAVTVSAKPYDTATGVTLNKAATRLVLGVNATEQLSAAVQSDGTTDGKVTWSSTDEAVATVDVNGLVTARAKGETIIQAEKDGKEAKCEVTVILPVENITLTDAATPLALTAPNEAPLKYTLTPEAPSDNTVSWFSNNAGVATVDSSGRVKALRTGEAIIYAVTKDGGFSAQRTVKVTAPVKELSLSAETLTLSLNGAQSVGKLTATVSYNGDASYTDANVEWTSSDTSIAIVSGDGVVTALKATAANTPVVITATTKGKDANGSTVSKTCSVTISESAVRGISVTPAVNTLYMQADAQQGHSTSVELSAALTGLSSAKINWSLETLSGTSPAVELSSVTGGSVTVTAKNPGTAKLTARSGDYEAVAVVTVLPVSVTSVSMNKAATRIDVDGTETLSASIEPQNASNKKLVWFSSDQNVASVSESGVVSALAVGTAVITAASEDGGFTASCTVTVPRYVSAISLNKASLMLPKGATEALHASVSSADEGQAPTNTGVTWSSDHPDIASVDAATGIVTAVAASETPVTITATPAGVKQGETVTPATCTVTVRAPRVTGVTIQQNGSNVTTVQPLTTGGTLALTAKVDAETGTSEENKSVTWSSSDTDVATVNGGTVTAVKAGKAVIFATAGGVTASVTVSVGAAATAVTICKSGTTSAPGDSDRVLIPTGTITLYAKLEPETAANKTILWRSSDTGVLTVSPASTTANDTSSTVTVTAEATGSASILATSADSETVYAACTFTVVSKNPVTGVTLKNGDETLSNTTTRTLDPETPVTLTATVTPSGAEQSVIWTSSNVTKAVVDQNGKVTGIEPTTGDETVTITATSTADSTKSASVQVKVSAKLKTVNLNKNALTLDIGKTETLTALVTPVRVTPSLQWTSDKPTVVTISNAAAVQGSGTALLTAVNHGTATVTAVDTNDGTVKAACTVTVPGLTLSQTSLALDKTVTTSKALTLTLTPAVTTPTEVEWTVIGNGNAVTLTDERTTLTAGTGEAAGTASTGITVQAAALGSATVKATWNGRSVYCPVTVTQIPSDGAELKLYDTAETPAEKTVWTAKVGDADLTLVPKTVSGTTATTVTGDLIWYSSDANVASVTVTNGNGTVKAKSAGEAVITAMLKDGSKTAACTVTVSAKDYDAATGVTLNKTSTTLGVSEQEQLTVSVSPATANPAITWTSSNETVATVVNGVVQAMSAGSATITAKETGGKSATCTVTVAVPVSSVAFTETGDLELTANAEKTLSLTVLPTNASNKTVTWFSSNTDVATVDIDGKVKALRAGNATIYAVTKDGGFSASRVVKVTAPVTSVTLSNESLELTLGGDPQTLTATVHYANDTDSRVTWTSSDNNVVTVSNGVLTAKSAGTATITATSEGTNASEREEQATCAVTVKEGAVRGLSVDQTKLTLYMAGTTELPKTGTLTATLTGLTTETVNWSVEPLEGSDAVATLSAATGATVTLTAQKPGTARVSAMAGDFTAVTVVTVKPVSVSSVTLNNNAIVVEKGATQALTATVTPNSASDKTVSWFSSNEAVATVSSNGTVTAVDHGTAVITAASADGGKTAVCVVTVPLYVTTLTLNKSTLNLPVNGSEALSATLETGTTGTPTKTGVTWTSGDSTIAEVNPSGVVTAKAVGSTTITAAANGAADNAPATSVCTVTVRAPRVTGVTIQQNGSNVTTVQPLTTGGTLALTAKVDAETGTSEENKSVTWSSSDTDVATVNGGTVTAVKAGKAVIFATAGGVTASVTVSVSATARTVTIYKNDTQEAPGEADLVLLPGSTLQLKAAVKGASDSAVSNETVIWSSGDKNILTVSESGGVATVTAVTPGTTSVIATSADDASVFATCTVTVQANVTSVSIGGAQVVTGTDGKKTLSLSVGGSAQLTAAVNPAKASQSVEWEVTEQKNAAGETANNIVTLTQTGALTASNTGTATITLKSAKDESKSETLEVTVTQEGQGITLNPDSLTLTLTGSNAHPTGTLTATITSPDATNKTVTWSSSNTGVVTLSESTSTAATDNGALRASVTLTAQGKGTAIITAQNGGRSATCLVTVSGTGVQNLKLTQGEGTADISGNSLSLSKNATLTLHAVVTPDTAVNKAVKWQYSSGWESAVTAEASDGGSTLTLTGKAPGVVTVIARTEDGGIVKTVNVTVPGTLSGITLKKDNAAAEASYSMDVNASLNLTAEVDSDYNPAPAVIWSSGDAASVVVDSSGRVTALKPTTSPVTVTASVTAGDVTKTASCQITVNNTVASLSLNRAAITLSLGQGGTGTETLTATYTPSSITNPGLTWTSDSPSVATVNASGTVTAVGPGTAQITVTATGGSTATCTVTVRQNAENISFDSALTLDQTSNRTGTLTLTVTPANVSEKTVSWQMIGDSSIVTLSNASQTLDANGKATATVTAGSTPGSVTVLATSAGTTKACVVTVRTVPADGTPVITPETDPISLKAGATQRLTASISGTEISTVTWSSDNNAIASVNSSGLVTANSLGNATITATLSDGTTATRNITVGETVDAVTIVNATGTQPTATELTLLTGGTPLSLKAAVTPKNGADPYNQKVRWYSSNPSVASITGSAPVVTNGSSETVSVAPVGPGTANIIAISAENASILNTVTVTVWSPATSVTLSNDTLTLNRSDKWNLSATVHSSSGTANPAVAWASANETIATVSEDGVVTAVAAGTTTVTATSSNAAGNSPVSATCTVTVPEYILSDSAPLPEITIRRDDNNNRIVEMAVDAGYSGYFIKYQIIRSVSAVNEWTTYNNNNTSITVNEAATIKAFAYDSNGIRGATVTATLGEKTEYPATNATITDKNGNPITNYQGDLKMTANITMENRPDETNVENVNVYLAVYNRQGQMITLIERVLNTESESNNFIYVDLKIPDNLPEAEVGEIKLIVMNVTESGAYSLLTGSGNGG